ncbi:CDP-alcohol phosphatidyltransferase family protein [Bacteroidales bacterium OttesenSCG-928-M06]|nr:CDP-alcohol phosphatidyltransferase family protein [Bacteroidales bacterium OttesenSCG-928-M06]
MKIRDFAQQLIYKIINPLIKGLIKIGVTPNVVTVIGLLLNILACAVFIYAAMNEERGDLTYVGWGGAIILFAGLFDMMDGQVARIGKMGSRFGALFDSVLDRYSELIVFFGICYYLILQGYFFSSMFAFLALIGSMMVSYVRARAEGLGIECKTGFMQRPERVVITALGAIACGLFYTYCGDYKMYMNIMSKDVLVFEPILILVIPIAFVAVFSNITAVGRINHCRKALLTEDN